MGWKTRKQGPLNLHKQSSYEFTETGAACTGPAWVYTTSLYIYYGFQLSIFMDFLNVRISGSLILVPSLELSSFCLFVLYNSDVFYLVFYFISFYYYDLKDCFLMRDRQEVDTDVRQGQYELEEKKQKKKCGLCCCKCSIRILLGQQEHLLLLLRFLSVTTEF